MNNKKSRSNINVLPEEILTDILLHVASNSITDLANAMLSCKAFLGVSNSHIFKHISMEKFNPVPWHKSEKAILKRCKKAGNTEALYRKGMLNIFSRNKLNSGLIYLKKAANRGHVEAIYVYGIMLICMGGDLRDQGLQILSSLNLNQRNHDKIACCRSRTKELLSSMWLHLSFERLKELPNNAHDGCKSCNYIVASTANCSSLDQDQAWKERNYLVIDNILSCDSCFWDREAKLFSCIFRKLISID